MESTQNPLTTNSWVFIDPFEDFVNGLFDGFLTSVGKEVDGALSPLLSVPASIEDIALFDEDCTIDRPLTYGTKDDSHFQNAAAQPIECRERKVSIGIRISCFNHGHLDFSILTPGFLSESSLDSLRNQDLLATYLLNFISRIKLSEVSKLGYDLTSRFDIVLRRWPHRSAITRINLTIA